MEKTLYRYRIIILGEDNMNRLEYLINNGDILDIMSAAHGVDKSTDEIKQCHLLKCCECKFNGDNCYSDMRDYLLEPMRYESEDKNENAF